jgi:hypothetical protein
LWNTAAAGEAASPIPAFAPPARRGDQREKRHPDQAWPVIREIFYDQFAKAKPNRAHEVLAA